MELFLTNSYIFWFKLSLNYIALINIFWAKINEGKKQVVVNLYIYLAVKMFSGRRNI